MTKPGIISFCLLASGEKGEALAKSISRLASGSAEAAVFVNAPSDFVLIPGAPFAYWTDESVRNVFRSFPQFDDEANGRATRCGLGTLDDFRFLRLVWELPSPRDEWRTYYHGGVFSPFYDSFPVMVRWRANGSEVKTFVEQKVGSASRKVQGEDKYFHIGFVFPRRTKAFSPKFMPPGGIFSTAGQAGFTPKEDLAWSIGLLASRACTFLISLSQGRTGDAAQFEVGLVKRLPWPSNVNANDRKLLSNSALSGFRLRVGLQSSDLVAESFVLPGLLKCSGLTLSARHSAMQALHFGDAKCLEDLAANIDQLALRLYGLTESQVGGLAAFTAAEELETDDSGGEEQFANDTEGVEFTVSSLLDYLIGCTFGRWDIRYATGEQAAPELPDPFAPLPVCPPGQLQNAQGLPARPEDVPAAYPVRIPWDGILVDDPNHPLDIERRVREVIEIIWGGAASTHKGGPTAEAIEHEACEILGVKSLRDYFRKPAGFFADHLKRYSKSRRQAPIYWPLSTASGSYTLWIYYHRLTPDTLYKCVQQFVNPKLADVEKELTHLRTVLAAKEGGAKERKRLEELEDLRRELLELRTELEHWAPKWKPNLNDGVLITACPLWKLFRLPKWRKDLEACWRELERGDYDWAHIAYTLWPDRVRERCKTDRSLAIAHGLEELCQVKVPEKKPKRVKTKTKQESLGLLEEAG